MKKILQSPKMQLELAFLILDAITFFMFYPVWHAVFKSTFLLITDLMFVLGIFVLCMVKEYFLKLYTPRLPVVAFANFMYLAIYIGAFAIIQNYFGSVFFTGLIIVIWLCVVDFINYFTSYPERKFVVKWYYIGEPILIYMCGVYTHEHIYKKIALFFVMLLILLYFWCTYLTEMIKYFEINRHMENVPTNNIFFDNSSAFVRILGILAIILLFASFFEFDGVFVWIGRIIVLIIAMIVEGFGKIMEFILSLFPGGDSSAISQDFQQTSEMLQKSSLLITILGYVLSFVLIVYLLRKCRGIFKRDWFDKDSIPEKRIFGRDSTDEVEDITPKEKVKIRKPRDNREKVRRIFKSKMEKKYSKKVPRFMTSNELADNETLADCYDEARYSDHEITSEQVAAAAQARAPQAPRGRS